MKELDLRKQIKITVFWYIDNELQNSFEINYVGKDNVEKHKELKFKYGYKIASIVTESILEHDEEVVSDHLWLTGVCSDEYFESSIIFIGDMLDSYFYGEVYTFRDNNYYDFGMDSIIDFFENTFACILREYDKPIKNFSYEIEKIDKKFDKERISEEDYEEKLEEYIEYFNNNQIQ